MRKVLLFLMFFTAIICEAQIKIGSYSFFKSGKNAILTKASISLKGEVEIPEFFEYGRDTYRVTIIQSEAFKDCSGITSIIVPDGVETINARAFENCTSLTEIIIPSSIQKVGKDAFKNCYNLTDVYCYAYNVPKGDFLYEQDTFSGMPLETATLHVAYSKNKYSQSEGWGKFGSIDNNMTRRKKTQNNVQNTSTDSPQSIEAIDLGLSVKWASMNIGASDPKEMGYPFAWGETKTKPNTSFGENDYNNPNRDSDLSYKYLYTYGINGTDYDTATARLGKHWRMPTKNEMTELCTKCKQIRHPREKFVEFVGPNGNRIIIPFSSFPGNVDIDNIYWSCNYAGNGDKPWALSFSYYDDPFNLGSAPPYFGGFVRAVYVE